MGRAVTRRARSRTGLLLLGMLAVALVGCGGGGGGGGDDGGADDGPTSPTPPIPSARILFPPTVGVTNQATITVRGVTTDSAEVAAVRVNGLPAASSDGFATWSRSIPLSLGDNPIRVDVETTTGSVLPDAATGQVRRTPVFVASPSSVDVDPGTSTVYVHDRNEGLLRFAPATSEWTVVSPEDGSSGATGGAFDASTNDYYQVYSNELVRIDVQTGVRTSVAGNGPSISTRSTDMDVDGNGYAYIVGDFITSIDEGVLLVNLATGDRFDFSSATSGAGPLFVDPAAVDVTGGGSGVYVFDAGPETLVYVDPTTRDRTELIDATATFTTSSLDRVGLVVEPANSRAYVATKGAVYLLDWGASTVTQVFDRAAGHEDELGAFQGIARAPGDRLVAIDVATFLSGGWTGLSGIDISTGVLTRYSDTSVGSGPASSLTDLEDVVVDSVRGRVLLLDGDGHLMALDLATGARSFVSSDTAGSGPDIGSSPEGLVFDGDRTVYASGGSDLYAIDVVTGARRLVSDSGMGTGPDFAAYGGLSWDPVAEQVVAGASIDDLLMRIDTTTGDRVPFTTEVLYDLYDVDLDALRGRIYMATEFPPVNPSYQILVADLATGLVTTLIDLDADTTDDLDTVELLASEAATGRLFVWDRPRIVELDGETAAQTFVADLDDVSAGAPASYVSGLAAAPQAAVLFATTGGGVLAIDADTGERVLIAK